MRTAKHLVMPGGVLSFGESSSASEIISDDGRVCASAQWSALTVLQATQFGQQLCFPGLQVCFVTPSKEYGVTMGHGLLASCIFKATAIAIHHQ